MSVIQTLPSTFMCVGVTMLVWRGEVQPFLVQRIGRDLLGLAVDLGGAGLIRHADPEIAVRIELEIERALRLLRPQQVGSVWSDDLAGLGIELADELVAEIGIPGVPVGIDHHVMRQRFFARQVVFGDDHLGGVALRARQRLEIVFLAGPDWSG